MSHPQDFYGPHDYYGADGFPENRVMGHPRDYLEPDILSTEAGGALPIASTVGAGPPGRGIYARAWSDPEHAAWGFEVVEDENDEVLFRSPSLIPGRIYLTQDMHNMVAGEPTTVQVHYSAEGAERTDELVINPGADGTRIFVRSNTIQNYLASPSHAFTCKYDELNKHEFHDGQHHLHPEPRVDDVIFGLAENNGRFWFTIGIIEWSNLDHISGLAYDVSYVVHTAYEIIMPHVGENGHWYFGDNDLGVLARGPQGDQGAPGHTPKIEIKAGYWYVDGQPTGWKSFGERGPEGHTPEVGLNGNWWVNGRDTGVSSKGPQGDPGETGPMSEVTIDPETGNWLVNGEDTGQSSHGEDGFGFDLQYNYYDIDDELPDYDSAPFGYAFVVHDTDPELSQDSFDLYYKGRVPVASEDGGPWVVIEDWQGRPGTSVHVLLNPYELADDIGDTIEIPKDQLETAFAPGNRMGKCDVVIDEHGHIGVVHPIDPDSDRFEIETVGKLDIDMQRITESQIDDLFANMPPVDPDTHYGVERIPEEDIDDLFEASAPGEDLEFGIDRIPDGDIDALFKEE